MPKRISDIFQLDPKKLREHNIFNGFVDLDSTLYVDPRLLETTSALELSNAYEKFTNFFADVLDDVERHIEGHCDFRRIVEKLKFPEIPVIGLGYSINSNEGKGIGSRLANDLAQQAVAIAERGIVDPVFFELAGLFIMGFGADRISDMTIRILLDELVQFSRQAAESLNLQTTLNPTVISGESFSGLPSYLNKGVLLIPQDILTSLPLAEVGSWTDADAIISENHELREAVNRIINKSWVEIATWKEIFNTLKKKQERHELLLNSQIIGDLITKYKSKTAKPYDFDHDPEDKFRWHDRARFYAKRFPLNLKDLDNESNEQIIDKIVEVFNNSLREDLCFEFYKKSGEANNEKIGQLILLELIENYAEGSHLNISYDSKTGFIKLFNRQSLQESKILLKYSSKRQIDKDYEDFIYSSQIDHALLNRTLILIKILSKSSRTDVVIKKLENLDRVFRDQGMKIPRKIYLEGRVEVHSGRYRHFRSSPDTSEERKSPVVIQGNTLGFDGGDQEQRLAKIQTHLLKICDRVFCKRPSEKIPKFLKDLVNHDFGLPKRIREILLTEADFLQELESLKQSSGSDETADQVLFYLRQSHSVLDDFIALGLKWFIAGVDFSRFVSVCMPANWEFSTPPKTEDILLKYLLYIITSIKWKISKDKTNDQVIISLEKGIDAKYISTRGRLKLTSQALEALSALGVKIKEV